MHEISALLDHVRQQVSAIALNDHLRAMLRQEQDWLTRAQLAISEGRSPIPRSSDELSIVELAV